MKLRTLSIVACLLSVGAGSSLVAAAQEGSSPIVTPPPDITIQDTPVGPMLADLKGFSLYVTDRDSEAGKSSCYGPCAEQWVPLRAQADTKPFGEWTLVPREDGRPQWAFRGRPLYRYRWEGKPRWAEANNDFWRYASLTTWPVRGAGRRGFAAPAVKAAIVLPPGPGGLTGQVTKSGPVLADAKGMTLYSRAASSPCAASCLDSYVAFPAPQAAAPIGDWTILAKNDGTQQWAYQGRPVYRSQKDLKPSDVNGLSDEWKPIAVKAVEAPPAASPAVPKSPGTSAQLSPADATAGKPAGK